MVTKTLNKDKLSFYDVKSRSKFVPLDYEIKIRNNRRFAVANNPKTGVNCWRVLGMVKK